MVNQYVKSVQKANLKSIFSYYQKRNILFNGGFKNKCIENIQETLQNALKNCDSKLDIKIKNKLNHQGFDTVVLGDIHGELGLFVQNLYLAGVIDKNGNYNKNTKKNVIQLGDAIDREGNHPFETLIYLRMLQKQAKTYKRDFILLFGNHEKFNLTVKDWWNENNFIDKNKNKIITRPIIQKILVDDIKNKRVQLSFASQSLKLFCFHGRMSKKTLLKVISKMYENETFKKRMNKTNDSKYFFQRLTDYINGNSPNERIKLMDVYKNIEDCGIKTTDISDWMNQFLANNVNDKDVLATSFLTAENDGIYSRNKKNSEQPIVPDEDTKKQSAKYLIKPVQIGGHTPTTSLDESRRANGFGFGIVQDKTSIFADADLVNGFQAFVGIDSKSGSVYAIELRDGKDMLQDRYKENSQPINPLNKKIESLKARKLEGLNVLKNCTSNIKNKRSLNTKNDITL